MVTGLAWTSVGGDLLSIEALRLPGKGRMKTTGKLGEVMKESIDAASSFVRSIAPEIGVKPVITSYSIHYTKLYELRQAGQLQASSSGRGSSA